MSSDSVVRRSPASLALRVTLLVGVAMVMVFLVFNWIVVRSLEMHFSEQDAGELEAVANAVVDTLRRQTHDPGTLQQRLAAIAVSHHGVFYGAFNADGSVIYTTPRLALSAIAQNESSVTRVNAENLLVWDEDGRSYRGVVLSVRSTEDAKVASYKVVAAMDIDFHLHFLRAFKQMQLWAVCIVLLIALLVAWLAVQWGHRPIRNVTRDIRAIRSSKLDVRLDPSDVPIELAELTRSFNDMISRIEDSFSKLSNFSADIAHELRTPLTNLITQTQVALSQNRSPEEYREILYSDLEEFDRMGRMISDMLFLAQTEHDPGNLQLSDVQLEVLLRGLFEYFEALAEYADVSLCLKGGALPIRADREMLLRALSNLLSNAIRHAPRGSQVTVGLLQDDQKTIISVKNPGPRIPEEYWPKLFDRFFRIDPARQRNSAGAGLGLAIVKSIAEAHGGVVSVASDDKRTTFNLALPRMP